MTLQRNKVGSTVSSGESKGGPVRISKVSKGRVVSRVIFLICLAAVAAILGVITYLLLTEAETTLAEEQFESMSDRALHLSLEIALRQRQGIITMASMAEQTFPDAAEWPFVNFKGFQIIASNVIATSAGGVLSLLPLVTPEELDEFNAFGSALFPEGPHDRITGLAPVNGTLTRYNETDGETYWGSPNKIFTPFMFMSSGPNIAFMANLHSLEMRGRDIDEMIACSEERAQDILQNGENENFIPMECSGLTNIIDLSQRNPIEEPAAVAYQPIFPANDPSVLAGFVTSTLKWADVLVDVFSSDVSGVDCVLETETEVYTYHITNGVATVTGAGDLHDTQFSDYGQSINLISPGLYSSVSSTYTLSVYPSDEFFGVYDTGNATTATIGAVCIIVFTSALFFLYDFFVRKEFNSNEALFKAKRQFVRFISHEVRTPLNAVCMGLQLLKDEAGRLSKTPPPQPEMDVESQPSLDTTTDAELASKLTEMSELSEDILNNANNAVDVLNDVLNYDKVESGTLHLELSVIRIWDLIERTSSEFHQQAIAKNIKYIIDFSPLMENGTAGAVASASELPQDVQDRKIVGDASRISQVLRNLISNALKFTPERGNLTVRAVWTKNTEGETTTTEFDLYSGENVSYLQSGFLELEVIDSGAGMSPEQQRNLFREGVQFNVNKLQAGQGSGLGLYIAKGLLEEHGGTLTAASNGLGFGTTFRMKIPLHYVPDVKKPQPALGHQASSGGSSTTIAPLNVLVVDDSAMSRKLLMRLLRNQGHVCEEAEDGLVAVEQVKTARQNGQYYDSVLMDYEMPRMDGPTAAQEMRKIGCDAFIIGITGNLFAGDVAHFKDCGANLVLPKPLKLPALLAAWMEHGVGSPAS